MLARLLGWKHGRCVPKLLLEALLQHRGDARGHLARVHGHDCHDLFLHVVCASGLILDTEVMLAFSLAGETSDQTGVLEQGLVSSSALR